MGALIAFLAASASAIVQAARVVLPPPANVPFPAYYLTYAETYFALATITAVGSFIAFLGIAFGFRDSVSGSLAEPP